MMQYRIRGVLELKFETEEEMMEFYYKHINYGSARLYKRTEPDSYEEWEKFRRQFKEGK